MKDMMHMAGIELFGRHGVFAEENKLGQKFIVDLSMQLDLSIAGASDNLEDTVDYAAVYETIKRIVEGPPFQLIEALAEKIAEEVLTRYTIVQSIIVKITKPNPPFEVFFRGVTVQIERKRVDYER